MKYVEISVKTLKNEVFWCGIVQLLSMIALLNQNIFLRNFRKSLYKLILTIDLNFREFRQ